MFAPISKAWGGIDAWGSGIAGARVTLWTRGNLTGQITATDSLLSLPYLPAVLVYGSISAHLQSSGGMGGIVAWGGIAGTIESVGSVGQVWSASFITATVTENGQPADAGDQIRGRTQFHCSRQCTYPTMKGLFREMESGRE